MTWLANCWKRFCIWIAGTGKPIEAPKSGKKLDEDAQELIALAKAVARARWQEIEDPLRTNWISLEKYQQMMREQMQATENVPVGVYRSGSFGVAQQQLSEDVKKNGVPKRLPLTLKVKND